MNPFVSYENEFDKKYRAKSDSRYHSFKAALNIINQEYRSPIILETGCQRLLDDWGGGCSTTIFLDYIKNYATSGPQSAFSGHLFSVDISPSSTSLARKVAEAFDSSTYTITTADSVEYLRDFGPNHSVPGPACVDLLYLDSYDYPYFELLNLYGGNQGKMMFKCAVATLDMMKEAEIVEMHNDLIAPSQEHCLKEIIAAAPLLHKKSVVLIDDNNLPGGGKSRLAKEWLRGHGWIAIIDFQQTLWIKR
jgi:hypothetical protein